MQVHRIHALTDNYIWILQQDQTAWVVDPGESEAVINWLQDHKATLGGILVTHHHYDHTNGIAALIDYAAQTQAENIVVYGGHECKHPTLNHKLKQGDVIQLGNTQFNILETPGHTLDHIVYYSDDILLSGDTLFCGGCGRVFEGTSVQMAESLLKIRALSDKLKVYCGHEYTLENLRFAHIAEPESVQIQHQLARVNERRQQGQDCVPTSLDLEKNTNPFLRFDLMPLKQNIIQQQALDAKTVDTSTLFGTLRAWKDTLDQSGALEQPITPTERATVL